MSDSEHVRWSSQDTFMHNGRAAKMQITGNAGRGCEVHTSKHPWIDLCLSARSVPNPKVTLRPSQTLHTLARMLRLPTTCNWKTRQTLNTHIVSWQVCSVRSSTRRKKSRVLQDNGILQNAFSSASKSFPQLMIFPLPINLFVHNMLYYYPVATFGAH